MLYRETAQTSKIRTLTTAAILWTAVLGCGDQVSQPTASRESAAPASGSPHPAPTQEAVAEEAAAQPELNTTLSDSPGHPPLPGIANASKTATEHPSPSPVQPVYRPADARPTHNDAALAKVGIHVYESRRLKLYTDIAPEKARPLPPLMDQAYRAWEEYFGPLPPARDGSDFQMTGYIMADRELFRRVGLLPEDLPDFLHGRHRGAEFWMNDQEHDYYRRHLMLHEGTHCFMTIVPGVLPPVWYLEGMAELFGTHWIAPEGAVRFRVMPHDKDEFVGLGRITMIQTDVKKTGYKSASEVTNLKPNDFLENEAYAWSWALCYFLDAHPRYGERFRQLGRHATDGSFGMVLEELFGSDVAEIETEWALFATGLEHGYDLARAAIDFRRGKPLTEAARVSIAADRGWQSSGVHVEASHTYQISASGQFTLAQEPIPWVSEPQGVSFRYFGGRPLGRLMAAIRAEPSAGEGMPETMLHPLVIGNGGPLTAPVAGTLYFRLNDDWSELSDNTGAVEVEIRSGDIAQN